LKSGERGAPQDPHHVDRQRTKITGSLSNLEILPNTLTALEQQSIIFNAKSGIGQQHSRQISGTQYR
jgi:hypothetical protein